MDDFLTSLATQSMAAQPVTKPPFGVQPRLASRFEPSHSVRSPGNLVAHVFAPLKIEEASVEQEPSEPDSPEAPMPERPAPSARRLAREVDMTYSPPVIGQESMPRPPVATEPESTNQAQKDEPQPLRAAQVRASQPVTSSIEEDTRHDTLRRLEQFVGGGAARQATLVPGAPRASALEPKRDMTAEPAPHQPPGRAVTATPNMPAPPGATPPPIADETSRVEIVHGRDVQPISTSLPAARRDAEPIAAIAPRLEPLAPAKPMGLPAQVESQPTIHVTIGRIEVRAAATPASRPARQAAPAPVLTLDEYLRQRNGGGR